MKKCDGCTSKNVLNYPYVDMHCDSLLRGFYENQESIYNGSGMQGLKRMAEAGQMAQFFAIFFPPRKPTVNQAEGEKPLPSDRDFFDLLRDQLYAEVEKHPDCLQMAHSFSEIMANWNAGLSSAILTVEDGRMVDGKMENLYYMYRKGVRAMALTWNGSNCFGYPNSQEPAVMERGLTEFGKEAIGEMNRLGMLVDVSHLSDGGFYDVARLSKVPFIASHSNCRELTRHPRNLTDSMIKLLAEKGGVAGINFCPQFVGDSTDRITTRVCELADHVMHFINVGGEECVGLGTDFDGVEGQLEIDHPEKMDLLFLELKKRGMSERVMEKVASRNVLRVIRDAMTDEGTE